MNYLVDDTLKSICGQIAAMDLAPDLWFQHDMERFDQGSHECMYSDEEGKSAFLFEFPGPRAWRYTAELTLGDVLGIHQGRLREIEITPKGGCHPEDAGMRKLETDPEVIVNAISDAINIYVRDVLMPRGVVSKEAWHGEGSEELLRLKYEIAKTVAASWKVCWIDDNA
jgi:hypothetical protein